MKTSQQEAGESSFDLAAVCYIALHLCTKVIILGHLTIEDSDVDRSYQISARDDSDKTKTYRPCTTRRRHKHQRPRWRLVEGLLVQVGY